MPVLHFSTFLKLLASPTAERIRNISRYAQPGGFDYWRPLRAGITRMALHDTTIEDARTYVSDNSSGTNRDNCIDRFDKIADWLARQPGTYSDVSRRGVWNSPNGIFSVHIEPELELMGRTGSRIIAFYPTDQPSLNRDIAGSGIVLLRRYYGEGSNSQFQIYDVNRNLCHRTPTNVSRGLLDADILDIERHFESF